MEIPYVLKAFLQKTEIPEQVRPARSKQVADAYASGTGTVQDKRDEVKISSESRLLQKLQVDYKKLESVKNSTFETRVDTENLSLSMSAEDIVEGILKGTLFEVI